MGRTVLLTGHPGIGKTTVVREVVSRIQVPCGGFLTEELRGPGGRQGFVLRTLDGEEFILAHRKWSHGPRVGRYRVSLEVLDRVGVRAIRRAIQAGHLVVVDEIGKMELLSQAFQQAVWDAITGPSCVLGTILAKPHPWADLIKTLPQVTLIEVTLTNRDGLADHVIALLSAT